MSAVVVGTLRQLLLNSLYRAHSLRPITLTGRERAIDEQQSHPCVIYQRPGHKQDSDFLDFFALDDLPTAFVGSGRLVNRWVVTVQLLRPGTEDMAQREYTTPPFAAHQVVDKLRSALGQVGMDVGPESLPGLQVRDRIYFAEADVSSDRSLLHSSLSELDLWGVIDNHQSPGHHFLETSMPIAGGELVTTVFVRVSVKARCLSLDVATCAMTRTQSDYQEMDAFAEHGAGAVLRSAVQSICRLPVEVWSLWRLLEIPMVLVGALWSFTDRTVLPRRGITVGARVAVRDWAADVGKNARLDLDKAVIFDHMKVIEQRIFKAAEDFLNAHNVDTSVFQKRATNIINSGVFNMGGTTEIIQSAVGISAKVNQSFEQETKGGRHEQGD